MELMAKSTRGARPLLFFLQFQRGYGIVDAYSWAEDTAARDERRSSLQALSSWCIRCNGSFRRKPTRRATCLSSPFLQYLLSINALAFLMVLEALCVALRMYRMSSPLAKSCDLLAWFCTKAKVAHISFIWTLSVLDAES